MPEPIADTPLPSPPGASAVASAVAPALRSVLWRGLARRCPRCGQGKLFRGYLKLVDHCAHCGMALGRIRADDAPPYFTILIVGHVVVFSMLALEQSAAPPVWVHYTLWPLVIAGLTWLLLPRIKGMVVGMHVRLGIKG